MTAAQLLCVSLFFMAVLGVVNLACVHDDSSKRLRHTEHTLTNPSCFQTAGTLDYHLPGASCVVYSRAPTPMPFSQDRSGVMGACRQLCRVRVKAEPAQAPPKGGQLCQQQRVLCAGVLSCCCCFFALPCTSWCTAVHHQTHCACCPWGCALGCRSPGRPPKKCLGAMLLFRHTLLPHVVVVLWSQTSHWPSPCLLGRLSNLSMLS